MDELSKSDVADILYAIHCMKMSTGSPKQKREWEILHKKVFNSLIPKLYESENNAQ